MSSNVLRPASMYGSVDGRSQGTSPRTVPTQPARVIAGGVQSAPMAPAPPMQTQPLQTQPQLYSSAVYATPSADSAQGLLPSYGTGAVRGYLAPRQEYGYVEKDMELGQLQEKFAPFACEFLGTFMLTFTVGCCSMTGSSTWNATAIGFVLMVLIYSVALVSGGNLNPAVSLTLMSLGKISLPTMIGYWIAQFAAAILAGLLVVGIFFKGVEVGPVTPYGLGSAAFCEIFYTAMLCFVVANCAASLRNNPKADGNQFYALAIGFVIIAGGYASGSISGAMFNPAVALGLDLANFTNGMYYGLVYMGFEAIGALIAALLFKMARPEDWSSSRMGGVVPAEYTPSMFSRLFSEFVGTYVLVTTVGLNVITKSQVTAWSAGAALMCMVYSLGNVSGGHFNPAVTLAAVLSGRNVCKGTDAVLYMLVQLIAGAIAGHVVTFIHADGSYANDVFGLAPGAGYTWLQTAIAEVSFTFLLAWVVLSVATVSAAFPGNTAPPKKNFYFALAIGACVTIAGFSIGSVSGGSINPAVSLGLSTEMIGAAPLEQSIANATTNSSVAADNSTLLQVPTLLGLRNSTNSTTNTTAATAAEIISPKFYYFGYYTLFELAGGVLAALMFHCTHAHEYYSKNQLSY